MLQLLFYDCHVREMQEMDFGTHIFLVILTLKTHSYFLQYHDLDSRIGGVLLHFELLTFCFLCFR